MYLSENHGYTASRSDYSGRKIRKAAPQVIHDITEQKPFTACAQAIILYVTTHPDISEGAKNLWMYLHMEASRFDSMSVRYSVEDLAEVFGATSRTIQRRLTELEAHDLLARESRYLDGRQLRNDIRVTLPYHVAQSILKHVPNRKRPAVPVKKYKSTDNTQSPRAPAHLAQEKMEEPLKEKKKDAETKQNPSDTCLTGCIEDNSKTEESCVINEDNPLVAKLLRRQAQLAGREHVDKPRSQDMTVAPEGDNSVGANNNTVQPYNFKTTMTETSTRLKSRYGIKTARMKALFSETFLQKNPQPLVEAPQPELSPRRLTRIQEKLEAMGFDRAAASNLAMEIQHSVLHGNWTCDRDKAVNACLKLVRQGRWSTPKGYVQ